MTEKSILQANTELMETTDKVYVSTIDDQGFPKIRVMDNLRNKKLYSRLNEFYNREENKNVIYLATNRASSKIQHIINNPKACIYFCNVPDIHGMALLGELEIVDDYNIRKEIWQDDWVPYEGGLEGSDYTVLRFRPVKTNGWYHCNKFEFELNS